MAHEKNRFVQFIEDYSERQIGQNTINVSELPTGILIFAVGNKR